MTKFVTSGSLDPFGRTNTTLPDPGFDTRRLPSGVTAMKRAPLTRAYTEMVKLGGTNRVRVTLNGDVCMLVGTMTVLDTDAPGGAATVASGPRSVGEGVPTDGTTGSS